MSALQEKWNGAISALRRDASTHVEGRIFLIDANFWVIHIVYLS